MSEVEQLVEVNDGLQRINRHLKELVRVSLKPGDVLVLKLSVRESAARMELLREWFADAFPGHPAIFLPPGNELSVIAAEVADACENAGVPLGGVDAATVAHEAKRENLFVMDEATALPEPFFKKMAEGATLKFEMGPTLTSEWSVEHPNSLRSDIKQTVDEAKVAGIPVPRELLDSLESGVGYTGNSIPLQALKMVLGKRTTTQHYANSEQWRPCKPLVGRDGGEWLVGQENYRVGVDGKLLSELDDDEPMIVDANLPR